MGEVNVPVAAYWGAQTQRAIDNFPVSNQPVPVELIHCLGLIKAAAAETNVELGLISKEYRDAITGAAKEVSTGKFDDQFPVDVFQTGSGTSSNMNANEVIANRANQLLGHPFGKEPIHPNDHVNCGQSSNDVFPTAIHLAVMLAFKEELIPALQHLRKSFRSVSKRFSGNVKIGRTHLQDAITMTSGQEFGAFAAQMTSSIKRIRAASRDLCSLPLGGTALGTGVNTHVHFAQKTIERLKLQTGLQLQKAENSFEGIAARDALAFTAGAETAVATALMKIANDLRLLSSGPYCGLQEILLPELQPGSSIMPGKVNPVIPESVIQVAAQVIGNSTAVIIGAQSGNLQLNVMMPMMARNLLESARLLAAVSRLLADKCIAGVKVNAKRNRELVEGSLAMATPLSLEIGYDAAARIAQAARDSGQSIREVTEELTDLTQKEINRIFGRNIKLTKRLNDKSALADWENEGGSC